jgi:hypothetical protein
MARVGLLGHSLRERMLQLTVFIFRRIEDHGLSRCSILIEAIPIDILVLNHEKSRLRPLALCVEADFPNNGVKFTFVNVVSKLVII